jgi:hypothetical protein
MKDVLRYANKLRRRSFETLIFLETLLRSVSGSEIDTKAVGADRVYGPHWPATKYHKHYGGFIRSYLEKLK